jgi:hypothetical protein
MDRRAPTLMWMRFPDSTNDIRGFFFGRLGVVDAESGTTVKWIDYEKLDKVSNRYVSSTIVYRNPSKVIP